MTVERVVVVGGTGNVGTSLVKKLAADPEVGSVAGIARRVPDWTLPKVTWAAADIRTDDLAGLVRGADVVVHLGWLFQPTHRPEITWANNVKGSVRVFDAVAEAGVPAPAWPVRAALHAAWRLHLVPASPGLFDTVLRLPLMDITRARTELGWTPRHTAKQAVQEFLRGLRHGAGLPTAPLASSVDGGRVHELETGVGERP